MLADPAASRELANNKFLKLPLASKLDSFDAGIGYSELRVAKVFDEAHVVASERLGLNEQRQSIVERQRKRIGRLVLLEPSGSKDAQA
jgi:hypothetical protein